MFLRKLIGRALAVTAVVAATAGIARAEAMDDILSRGVVRVAIAVTAPPFGFMNDKNEPDGSDVAAAKLLAKDLGVKLEIVPVTASNRMAYLQSGRVDLTMSTLSVDPQRAKVIDFSSPYETIRAVVLAPKDVKITSPADLVGKKISAPRGTTNEADLAAIAPEGAEIIRFDDEAGAMNALASGQVDAYAVGEPLAGPLRKRFPDRDYEAKIVLRNNYQCVGMPRGNPALLQWVNSWVFYHLHSTTELRDIYKKYIGIDLPNLPPI